MKIWSQEKRTGQKLFRNRGRGEKENIGGGEFNYDIL
jgi:hypothetical protein